MLFAECSNSTKTSEMQTLAQMQEDIQATICSETSSELGSCMDNLSFLDASCDHRRLRPVCARALVEMSLRTAHISDGSH